MRGAIERVVGSVPSGGATPPDMRDNLATGKVRIFELAKELGLSSKELIALLTSAWAGLRGKESTQRRRRIRSPISFAASS